MITKNNQLPPDSPYRFENIDAKMMSIAKPTKPDTANTAPINNTSGVFGLPPKPDMPMATVSTSSLNKTPKFNVVDNSGLIKNIQTTYDKYGGSAGANEAFVRGALKASGKAETPELIAQYSGKKLGDVISGLGLGEKITGFGVKPLEATNLPQNATNVSKRDPITGEIINPTAEDVSDFNAKYETISPSAQRFKTLEEMANAMSGNIDKAYKDAGVQAYAEEVNRLGSEIDKLDTSEKVRGVMANIEAQDLKDKFAQFQKEFEGGEAKTKSFTGIVLGNKQDEINQKLQGLSSQEVRDLATYTLNKTNLAQQLQVAQGNYQIASNIAKESAESMKWAFDKKLDLYSQLNLIDKDERNELSKKNDDDFAKMEKGYVQITPDQEKKYEQDILSGKADGSIYKDVYGNKWFKPKSTEPSELELYANKKAIDSLYEQGKISDSERKEMLEKQKSDVSAVEQANSALNLLNTIYNYKDLAGITGTVQGRMPAIFSEDKAQMIANIDSLKNLLTLQNLGYLKGAMSDKDIVFITSASSALTRTAGPENVKNQLDGIRDTLVKNKLKAGAYNSFQEYYVEGSDKRADELDALLKANPDIDRNDLLEQIRSDVRMETFKSEPQSSLKGLKIGGKDISVSPDIADKIAMADRDFFNATGKHLQINQSYRTREQQAKLYEELSKKGARVAPPGKSFHERGLAIDVSNWEQAEPYLRKYGLKNNLADDKGHFSLGEFA